MNRKIPQLGSWQRLDEKRLSNISVERDRMPPAIRIYGWNGAAWPRLAVTLFLDYPREQAFKLTAARRDGTGSRHWWRTVDVPVHLVGDVAEMIAELRQKLPEHPPGALTAFPEL